ncbi:MAG TPA: hypothetical protein PKZ82_15850, partial [Microthrixaceae bacterium]|nr:hypothetical protein [Microthrixaceae bacterium]
MTDSTTAGASAEPTSGDLPATGTADLEEVGVPAGSAAVSRLESVLSLVSPVTSSPGAPLETTN